MTNRFTSETEKSNSLATIIDQDAFIKALTEAFNNALKIVNERNQNALKTFLLGQENISKLSKDYEEKIRAARLNSRARAATAQRFVSESSDSGSIPQAPEIKTEPKSVKATSHASSRPMSLGSLFQDIRNGKKLNSVSLTSSPNPAQKGKPASFENELLAKLRKRGMFDPTSKTTSVKPVLKAVKVAPKVAVKTGETPPPPPPAYTTPAITVKNIKSGHVTNPLLDAIRKGTKLNKTSETGPLSKKTSVDVGSLTSAIQEHFKNGTKLNKTIKPTKKKKVTLEELKAQLASAKESLKVESNLFEKRRIAAKISDLQELIASKEVTKKETSRASAKAALVKKSEESAKSHLVTKNTLSPEAKKKQRLLARSLKKTRANDLKDRGFVRSMSMGTIDRSAAIADLEKKSQKAFQKGTRSLIKNGYKAVAEQQPEIKSTAVEVKKDVQSPVTKKVEPKLDENGILIPPPLPVASKSTKVKVGAPSIKKRPEASRSDLLSAIRTGKALKQISGTPSEEEDTQEDNKLNLGTASFTLSRTFTDIFKNGFEPEEKDEDNDWDEDDWNADEYDYSYSTSTTTQEEKESFKPPLRRTVSSPALIMSAPQKDKATPSKALVKESAEDLRKKEAEERSKSVSLLMKQKAQSDKNPKINILDQIRAGVTGGLKKVDLQTVKKEKELEEQKNSQNMMFAAITSRRSSIEYDDWDN